jgi:DNA-directed RNA polymerase subunit RPC12/RpoP
VTSTVGKYATEIAVINCPKCGTEKEIVAEDYAEWTCRECGYEPDYSDHGNGEDEVYRCIWCGDPETIVTLC